ncbi:hypothetical protein J8273_3224 [Carpediemonas membranifera]|uniref:Nucleoporin Nup54 alpha-helical domain-containing protein n=1 Tax=Carpediemonas membranifera TaxID=201153 RepID=A0A8J6AUW4_9EUKA|nr:hypothetical protein J8273_3224 [Carpediemonas membranifera]|eukprot:KAG9393095.1 hypothetical protein J8273_3224 [Carpediemonas membranifera]
MRFVPTSSAPSHSFGQFGSGSSFSFGANAAKPQGAATPSFGAPAGGFGSTPAPANTGFGAQPASGGNTTGFGASATTTPANTGFSGQSTGFGASTGTAGASTGFGGFGASAQKPAGTTGFGAPATGTSTTTTGFGAPAAGASTTTTGFGAPASGSTGFGAAAGSTGFGAKPAGTTGFGSTATTGSTGFGSTTQPGAATTGFGAKPATTGFGASTGTTGTAGFGASTASTGFGSSISTTGFGAAKPATGFGASTSTGFGSTGTSGFGSSGFGAKPAGTTGFGASTGFGSSSGFGASASTGFGQQAQQQALAPHVPPLARAELISHQLTPGDPQCVFPGHVLFNYQPAACTPNPPPGQDPAVWRAVQRHNPDPTKYVPVIARSFEDLQARIQSQHQQGDVNTKAAESLRERTVAASKKIEQCNSRAWAARHRQLEMSGALLHFINGLEALRMTGVPETAFEQQMARRIGVLKEKIAGEGNLYDRATRLDGRVSNGPVADDVKLEKDVDEKVRGCLEQMLATTRELQAVLRGDSKAIGQILATQDSR